LHLVGYILEYFDLQTSHKHVKIFFEIYRQFWRAPWKSFACPALVHQTDSHTKRIIFNILSSAQHCKPHINRWYISRHEATRLPIVIAELFHSLNNWRLGLRVCPLSRHLHIGWTAFRRLYLLQYKRVITI